MTSFKDKFYTFICYYIPFLSEYSMWCNDNKPAANPAFLRTSTGQLITVYYDKDSCLQDIKDQVATKTWKNVDDVDLIYAGTRLTNEYMVGKSIADLFRTNDSDCIVVRFKSI